MSVKTMPCLHGLDENNCPICRISLSMSPINQISDKELDKNPSDKFNKLFKNKLHRNVDFKKDIIPHNKNVRPNLIHDFPKPNLINPIPNFENKLFLERASNLNLEKKDDLLLKKVPIENQELNLEEE